MSTDGEEKGARSGFSLTEPERLWGAKGNGDACSHCERPINADEAQLELVRPGGQPVLLFHVHCYHAWREKSA